MAKIALIPEGDDQKTEFLKNLGIPINYMEDFSVLGIVVDRYPESVAVLKNSRFSIDNLDPGAIISFDHPAALVRILDLLRARRIRCNYRDIADSLYQA